MTDKNVMRGIFSIPSTPFNADGTIDTDGFKNEIEFIIACGAHGIVFPVNASEFTALSDNERFTLSEILVKTVSDRIPTVIGVAGTCRENAAMFAKHAHDIGASAVIAMPPYVRAKQFTEENTYKYYEAISSAARIPVFIQNYVSPIGTDMSSSFLMKLCKEIEYIQYVKEETVPSTVKIQELTEKNTGECLGIFGGSGCRYLMEEYRRGACGNMPGCHVTDVCVALWNSLESGNLDRAFEIYKNMAPLFFFETQFSNIYKEVLKERGIIHCAYTRNNTYELDKIAKAYLKEILDMLRPFMTV